MQENIGKVIIDYKEYLGKDLYSDGKVEDEMLDIAMNNSENDFNRLIAERNSWPILYHFSHIRTNVVTWLPITKNDRVLEIGSGCGAITGALSDMAFSVDCIELSKKRSMINAYRNIDKDNICIKVGNFNDIEKKLEEKYDYITLIGVFEYAESYIDSSEPYIDFLTKIGKHLKENGKIIIAIENKYGLKYWAGCKEDHVSDFFEGIEGYSKTSGVKTFSKNKLEKIVKESRLEVLEFYYPYPDYKFPNVIFSDKNLPQKGDLIINRRNFDNDRLVLFDEEKVYEELIEDGMFEMFSNSFILVIGKGDIK